MLSRLPRAAPLLACLALALALTVPAIPLPRATYSYVVALDITQSMSTEDYRLEQRPASRLAYAKHALHRALHALPCGSRIGWAVFTEYRVLILFTPVELCGNFSELAAALDRIDGQMAWAGASEIAKGLYSGIRTVKGLEQASRLVFVTDGHEAPPLHARLRPHFDGNPGDVAGLIVGVGGDLPLPIPKRDPDGKALGFWGADEVMQTDTISMGRSASVRGEGLVDESGAPEKPSLATGNEHLSSLKQEHLRALALETGLHYVRLDRAETLVQALTKRELADMSQVRTDIRFVPAALALVLLVWPFVGRLRVPLARALSSRT